MPIYEYQSIGKPGRGVIDAANLQEAKQKLLNQSIFILSIHEANSSSIALKPHETLRFIRELSRLLKAGLPLYESLRAMEEKYRGQKGQKLLLDLAGRVRTGERLSQALAQHPFTFDALFIAMIANAEKAGHLSSAFEELSRLMGKQLSVRKQLINAFLYPSFLFGFCLLVLSVLLFYVVPSLKELFEGRALHPMTRVVFGLSETLLNSKRLWLSFLGIFSASSLAFSLHPQSRHRIFSVVLRFPLIRNVLAKAALVRFCRAAATLLEGSVPIVEALSQASTVMRHSVLRQSVEAATKKIQEGQPIDEAFQDLPFIPSLVPRMLGIAKESGNLAPSLRHLSEIYEDDLERLLSLFASLAQPILLLFLGVVIGVVLLSVLIPLTDASSFIN